MAVLKFHDYKVFCDRIISENKVPLTGFHLQLTLGRGGGKGVEWLPVHMKVMGFILGIV